MVVSLLLQCSLVRVFFLMIFSLDSPICLNGCFSAVISCFITDKILHLTLTNNMPLRCRCSSAPLRALWHSTQSTTKLNGKNKSQNDRTPAALPPSPPRHSERERRPKDRETNSERASSRRQWMADIERVSRTRVLHMQLFCREGWKIEKPTSQAQQYKFTKRVGNMVLHRAAISSSYFATSIRFGSCHGWPRVTQSALTHSLSPLLILAAWTENAVQYMRTHRAHSRAFQIQKFHFILLFFFFSCAFSLLHGTVRERERVRGWTSIDSNRPNIQYCLLNYAKWYKRAGIAINFE